jgi:hypothetical protein
VTADEIFAAVLARELHERGIECSDIATLVTGVRLARQFVPPPVANDVAPVIEVVANAADVANAKPKRKRDRSAYMRGFMRRKRAAERKATP